MQGGGSGAHAAIQERLLSAIRHIAEAQRLIDEFLGHCAGGGPRSIAHLAHGPGPLASMDAPRPPDDAGDEVRP